MGAPRGAAPRQLALRLASAVQGIGRATQRVLLGPLGLASARIVALADPTRERISNVLMGGAASWRPSPPSNA